MMHPILLITQREYLTRVRKKSFIIMTILAPLLVVLFYGLIIYLAVNREVGSDVKEVYVSDLTGRYADQLQNNSLIRFTFGERLEGNAQKKLLEETGYYAILDIDSLQRARLVCAEQPSISTVDFIQSQLNTRLKDHNLVEAGIDPKTISNINSSKVRLSTVKLTQSGEQSGSAAATTAIGFISAIAIYMFIFLYGVQVMQGVIEEKTNRIVEVIVASVKPFQLMMGKIIGIAMVGLTQFLIWIILVSILGGSVSGIVLSQLDIDPGQLSAQAQNSGDAGEMLQALLSFNYPLILGMFLFYFLSGYLFYGALFAAIGAAVDNETDKQQFMLPVTLPLIFAFGIAQSIVVNNPNSAIAVWLSIIPFTSQVVMMVRLPFGVPGWQLALSVVSMIAGFMLTVALASRIYRVGILMYGKKASYKELAKWLFYKS